MHTRHCINCFILRHSGPQPEVLLLKRGLLEDYPGTWQPMAGQIEHGDSSRQAVLRHMEQVTQLEPIALYALNRTRTSFLPRHDAIVHATVFVAFVDPAAQVKMIGRHAEHRWMAVDELDNELLFTVDREALAELRRDILGNLPVKAVLEIPLD